MTDIEPSGTSFTHQVYDVHQDRDQDHLRVRIPPSRTRPLLGTPCRQIRPAGHPGRAARSLIARIDQAFAGLPQVRPGAGPYLRRLAERGWSGGEPPRDSLRDVVVDVAAELYRDQADLPVELLEFSDGVFDVLFDAAHELTILMHGLSRSTPPNSRDQNYHRGFPGRAGYDKGHAMSHAQGGREGGPNYFPQAPRVNRRLSPMGTLWRDIESYLAANPGLFCFVRLAYPRGTSTDVPAEVEYGVHNLGAQAWAGRSCRRTGCVMCWVTPGSGLRRHAFLLISSVLKSSLPGSRYRSSHCARLAISHMGNG